MSKKRCISYEHVLNYEMVFVSIDTFLRQADALSSKGNNITSKEKILLNEIEEILFNNIGKRDVLLPSETVMRLISKENTNIFSFKCIC